MPSKPAATFPLFNFVKDLQMNELLCGQLWEDLGLNGETLNFTNNETEPEELF